LQKKKSTVWPGLSIDAIMIQNGIEGTHEPQDVGLNEQWLIRPE